MFENELNVIEYLIKTQNQLFLHFHISRMFTRCFIPQHTLSLKEIFSFANKKSMIKYPKQLAIDNNNKNIISNLMSKML